MSASDKFVWGPGDLVPSQCALCARFSTRADLPGTTCAAFPGFIPAEILGNRFDHRNPHPDDGGLQFVPVESAPPDALDRLYRRLDALAD